MENLSYIDISKLVTIVIPSYNEERYIERTLRGIIRQNSIYGTRIIVADNHSTDKTRKIVRVLSEIHYPHVKIELIDGGPVGVARNKGAILSNTKYVLFVDADVMFMSNTTIHDTLIEMEKKNLYLLTCRLKSYADDIRSRFIFKLWNVINYFMSKKTPFAVGTYFMTRRDIFYRKGMFDETLNNSEDYALSKKYPTKRFKISKHFIGQDDRRFKKIGYIGMVVLLIKGFINRNNPEFFKKDIGYWGEHGT